MQAWKIFTHSVRQVFGNFGPAVRLSAVLYVAQWSILLVLEYLYGGQLSTARDGDVAELAAMRALFGPALLSLVVVLIADIWIAVAWHRYVLNREESAGLLPRFEGRRILGYFGGMVLLVLIVAVLAAGLALFGSLILGLFGQGPLLTAATLILGVVIGGLMLRVSTVLPGYALEPGHRISEGWVATRGHSQDFILLTLITAGGMGIIQTLVNLALSPLPLVYIVFTFGLQWVTTMVGISILTTLYGHYIEKRALV